MDQVVYKFTGTCCAEITKEQYDNGLMVCGAESCTMKGQPFKKMQCCSACHEIYMKKVSRTSHA